MKKFLTGLLSLLLILTISGCTKEATKTLIGYKEVTLSGEVETNTEQKRITVIKNIDDHPLTKTVEEMDSSGQYVLYYKYIWEYEDDINTVLTEINEILGYETVKKFNSNGTLKSIDEYRNNVFVEKSFFSYDENGNEISCEVFDEKGNLIRGRYTAYFADGKLASEVTIQGINKDTVLYQYDNAGYLENTHFIYQVADEIVSEYDYPDKLIEVHDDQGRVIFSAHQNFYTGKYYSKCSYDYDVEGNLANVFTAYYDGDDITCEQEIVYTYRNDASGKLNEFTIVTATSDINGSSLTKQITSYDEQGRETKVETYAEDELTELSVTTYSEIYE